MTFNKAALKRLQLHVKENANRTVPAVKTKDLSSNCMFEEKLTRRRVDWERVN